MLLRSRLLTEDWRLYDGSTAVHRPERIAPDRLTELYWWLNRRVFSWRSILRRTVFRRDFWKRPLMYLFALVVNLHYRHYVYRRVPPNIF